HRDIKPANLVRSADGAIKLLDMGLARIVAPERKSSSQSLTHEQSLMGTVAYMSPEQAVDTRHADERSDIYSLGCPLYYLRTGRAPYSGAAAVRTLVGHREGAIPSLRAARSGVPEGLDEVFRRMVAKKPEDRFPTMAEVIRALEPFVASAPRAVG